MTLQCGKAIRIWGETDTPQVIQILCNNRVWIKNVHIENHFSISLPPQKAMENVSIRIIGTTSVILENVDFGEVWIAGGQSNMEFLLKYDLEGLKQISEANDPHLRFYDVGEYSYEGEEQESPKNHLGWDKWLAFNPENAEYFSAVGLYFAKVLRACYNIPVAIVGCNWGGTSASSWIAECYLESEPQLRVYLDDYKEITKNLDMNAYVTTYKEGQKALFNPGFLRYMDKLMAGKVGILDTIRMISIGPKL